MRSERMSANLTELIVILDASGSMAAVKSIED
jgi:Mg-chelatase subunit ChlD